VRHIPRFAFAVLGSASFLASTTMFGQSPATSAAAPCSNLPHADHPQQMLTNGALTAALFLPDTTGGYYRSTRFDWAGVIGCVSYKGHTYFGEWFNRYDPMINDAIVGPVEEFRSPASEIGYDAAAINGSFLKIGVGVLRKIDDSPYKFGGAYPLVDTGKRTTHVSKRSVTFTQYIKTDFGYAYRYEKTVELDKHGAVLSLKHKLTNLGTKTIETDVYDHDFFILDGKPVGPSMSVHLGFAPIPEKPFSPVATVAGNDVSFNQAPGRPNTAQGYLTGYTGKPGEYSIAVEDKDTHVGVEQTSASPLSKFYFWSTAKTICPEAYIHIHVAPGAEQSWTIRYQFKAE
jgi:hypothetical protein